MKTRNFPFINFILILSIIIFSGRQSYSFEVPFFGYYENPCLIIPVQEPPFFITDSYEMGDKAYEYLREVKSPTRYIEEPQFKTLLKRSIVTVLSEFIEKFPDWYYRTERDPETQFFIPIKIQAIPTVESLESLKFYNDLRESQKKIDPELIESIKFPAAKVNEIGKIRNNALLQPENFYYFVTKSTSVFNENKNGLQILPFESVVKPAMDEKGNYLTCQKTCKVEGPGAICKADYLLDVVRVGSRWQTSERIRINPYTDQQLMNTLRPLGEEYFFSVSQLMKEFEKQGWITMNSKTPLIDQMHLVPMSYKEIGHEELRVRIPIEKELALEVGEKISEKKETELSDEEALVYQYNGVPAAYHSWMYRPIGGNSSLKLWNVPSFYAYMDPRAACSFNYLLKKWNKDHPEPQSQIQWGEAGIHLVDEENLLNIRSSHQSGFAVDIRPLKKHLNEEGVYEHDYRPGVTYKDKSRYDLEKTFKLVELALDSGGIVVFNDLANMNHDGITRVHWVRGHSDHLHISFATEQNILFETKEEFLARLEKMNKSCERLTQDDSL